MKFSIILPTMGRESLEDVLEGIFACNGFFELEPEVLVVFGGKRVWSRELRLKFPGVDFYKLTIPQNVSAARNFGIELATGDILIFLMDDTIPAHEWLSHIVEFHKKYPGKVNALLGKLSWPEYLEKDPFHVWYGNCVTLPHQRSWKSQKMAHWQHFCEANISLKKSLIGEERFNTDFSYGVGIDNSEMGYRLACKGMKMRYDPKCEVIHNHPHTLEEVCEMFSKLYENARFFETLHPEVHVVPRKRDLFWIQVFLPLAKFWAPIIPEARWWYEWKKVWIQHSLTKKKKYRLVSFFNSFFEAGKRFTNL
jgi:glycosyltransferase involved in cell wall biosynthesis